MVFNATAARQRALRDKRDKRQKNWTKNGKFWPSICVFETAVPCNECFRCADAAELQAKSLENFRSHLFTKCCFCFSAKKSAPHITFLKFHALFFFNQRNLLKWKTVNILLFANSNTFKDLKWIEILRNHKKVISLSLHKFIKDDKSAPIFYVNFCKIIKIYHYLQKTNDFTGILRP